MDSTHSKLRTGISEHLPAVGGDDAQRSPSPSGTSILQGELRHGDALEGSMELKAAAGT